MTPRHVAQKYREMLDRLHSFGVGVTKDGLAAFNDLAVQRFRFQVISVPMRLSSHVVLVLQQFRKLKNMMERLRICAARCCAMVRGNFTIKRKGFSQLVLFLQDMAQGSNAGDRIVVLVSQVPLR